MTYFRNQSVGKLAKKLKTPCLQGSTSTLTALRVMHARDVDIVGVMCEEDFVGTFSRSNFEKSVIRRNLVPAETTLYEVMHISPPYVKADLSINQTFDAMIAYQWDYMPVLEGKTLCGIVSMNDIKIVQELIEECKSLIFNAEKSAYSVQVTH